MSEAASPDRQSHSKAFNVMLPVEELHDYAVLCI
jgi:hypothetical protein